MRLQLLLVLFALFLSPRLCHYAISVRQRTDTGPPACTQAARSPPAAFPYPKSLLYASILTYPTELPLSLLIDAFALPS
jgi:hypothetical protein